MFRFLEATGGKSSIAKDATVTIVSKAMTFPASLPRTGQATLMASDSTGADFVVDKTTPLDRLMKSVLPGVGSQLDDVRNECTLLTTTSLSPLLATGKQT